MKYRVKGVTFIELIIVVAVLSILSLFALNSYQSQRKKSMLVAVNQAMVEKVGQAHEWRLRNRAGYNNSKIIDLMNQNSDVYYGKQLIYKLNYISGDAGSFKIEAHSQKGDFFGPCSKLTINHLNEKTPSSRVENCWRN